MNKNQNNIKSGLNIPRDVLKESGMDRGNVNCISASGLVVLVPEKLNALETLRTAELLRTIGMDMLDAVEAHCAPCVNCAEKCPYSGEDLGRIRVPDDILEKAGIPKGAKLCAEVDKEDNSIRVMERDCGSDITDVPRPILELIRRDGTCLNLLDLLIQLGEVVYDGD